MERFFIIILFFNRFYFIFLICQFSDCYCGRYNFILPLSLQNFKLHLSVYNAIICAIVIYNAGETKIYHTAGYLPPASAVRYKAVVTKVDRTTFYIPPAINAVVYKTCVTEVYGSACYIPPAISAVVYKACVTKVYGSACYIPPAVVAIDTKRNRSFPGGKH